MSVAEAGALERINAWVSERTKGLIPALLDRLPGHPGLVALNALHFKDRWQAPFDPASTRSEPFHTADGREVETPMMHLASGVRRFRQDDRFVAAELPFATARYALVVVTTREGAARPSALGAAADWLGGEGFAEAPGTVALPRFKLSGSADLLDVLDRMGLSPARNAGDALAGLAAGPQTIARVVQKTEIRVDEEGAEAAAATAVTTSRSLTAGGTVRLVADRPFLFALRDRETGLIPVAGYVGEPTEATVAAK